MRFLSGSGLAAIVSGWLAWLLFLPAVSPAWGEGLVQRYRLPPLNQVPADTPAADVLATSRALRRAFHVPVPASQVADTDAYRRTLVATLAATIPPWPEAAAGAVFDGSTTSELNAFLAATARSGAASVVRIASPVLTVDETVRLPAGIFLDGPGVRIEGDFPLPVFLLDRATRDAGIRGLVFRRLPWPLTVRGAQRVRLQGMTLEAPGWGVTVQPGSRFVGLEGLEIVAPRHAGVLVQGGVEYLSIIASRIVEGQSAANGGAAIVVTDSQGGNPDDPASLSSHAALAQPLWPVAPVPRRILIARNVLEGNRAQGLYLDGVHGAVIEHNRIAGNDKEGVCLDFGSSLNLVLDNTIEGNGRRARQSDDDLRIDLVLDFGRMKDGSAVAKLPGISLDNAVYNLIMGNTIRDNAGDGVKLVRSSHRNFILFNSILDNDRGHNRRFQFFGVLLGSAGAESQVAADASHPLDFAPPVENTVAGNLIYGAHRAAVLLDFGAAHNRILDNLARHYRTAPMESASRVANRVEGNSWNDAGGR